MCLTVRKWGAKSTASRWIKYSWDMFHWWLLYCIIPVCSHTYLTVVVLAYLYVLFVSVVNKCNESHFCFLSLHTQTLTHSHTQRLTHSHKHSLTHTNTHSHTHSLTHSHTQRLQNWREYTWWYTFIDTEKKKTPIKSTKGTIVHWLPRIRSEHTQKMTTFMLMMIMKITGDVYCTMVWMRITT